MHPTDPNVDTSVSNLFDSDCLETLDIGDPGESGVPTRRGDLPVARSASTDASAWLASIDPIPVIAWPDASVTAGFEPTSLYVETYWLPILGPSATWALRRLSAAVEHSPSGTWVPKEPFARTLGLSGRLGRHNPLVRTLHRLVLFRMAIVEDDVLAVRTVIPPLTDRALRQLPGHLVVQHAADYPDLTADGAERAAQCSA